MGGSRGKCFQSFLHKRLIHRALIYVAPKVMGDQAASAFQFPFDFQEHRIQWRQIGQDVVCDIKF